LKVIMSTERWLKNEDLLRRKFASCLFAYEAE